MKTPRILTIGSVNIDLMANISKIPAAGQTIKENGGYEYIPGGKGANAALAVHRLGGESIFCAKRGNDTHGSKLADIYSGAGINTRFISSTLDERTGLAIVMVESNGNNRIITYPGANNELKPEDAEEAMTCYPDALLVQFEIPVETVLAAAKYARELNIPIIVDAGPAVKDFPLEELGPVDIFSPNETEVYAYTGVRPNSTDNCLKACMALANKIEAKYYVLKLGDRGSYLYDVTIFYVFPAHNVESVDTTAAGDVFTAALAVEYMRSDNIRRACEYANIAGALSVTKQGAFTSVPSNEDVRDFVLKNEINYQLV